MLIEEYVEALSMRDSSQRLPLHVAIESANWTAVAVIVNSFPAAATRRNLHGVLPYAEAGERGAPEAALSALLIAWSEP